MKISSLRSQYLSIPINSFRYRYLSGTFWMLLGTGFAQFCTFATMVLAARILGSEEFGKFGIIQSTLGVLGLVAGLGLGLTNKRYVAELRVQDPERCGRVIGYSSVLSWITSGIFFGLLLLTAQGVARELLDSPNLVLELRIAAVLLLFTGLNEAQMGVLSGLEAFKKISQLSVVRAILTIVLLPLAVWFFKLPGLLAGMALIAFGMWLYSGQVMRLETRKFNIKINYIDIRQEFAIFPNFSLPVIISGIIPVLVFWIAKTILLRTPGGYAQLGIFTATEQWLIVLAFIPGQMANVSQPILSSIYATRDTQRFRKAVVGNIVFPVSIAILFGLVIIAFSRWIPKLYGDNYSSMASIMLIMCIVGILRVFGGAVGTLLVTINKMWPSFWINLIWGSVLIVSMILLAPLGARGLALSNALAYGVHALLGLTLFLYLQQTLWKKE